MAFPIGAVGAGFFHGLTNNIEEARKGQTERAKLLGQLMGLGPELPEDIRSQIASFTQPESRMSEVMGGLGLTSAPREDLNRLTGLAARAQGYLSSIPLQKERMADQNLKAALEGTPTKFDFSMPDENNPLPDENRPLALAPPPKVALTQGLDLPSHLRTYLGLEAGVDPLGALKTVGQYALREPQKPTVVNQRPGSRALLLGPTGEVTQTIEGPPATETRGPELIQLQHALQGMDDRGVPEDSPARLAIQSRVKRITEGIGTSPEMVKWHELRNQLMQKQLEGNLTDQQYITAYSTGYSLPIG